ncbi:MAG: hypothetical protein ACD_19C00244G0002, partial [uncultured bacterium]
MADEHHPRYRMKDYLENVDLDSLIGRRLIHAWGCPTSTFAFLQEKPHNIITCIKLKL